MKVLCDVHISFKVVRYLQSQGLEALHVNDVLDGDITKDKDICQYADENDMVVISKDADFQNSFFLLHTPKKLLKINLGNISTKELIQILEQNLFVISESFKSSDCLVEIDKEIIRITYPSE